MPEALGQTRDGATFPIRSYAMPLPSGDAGTKLTVELMIAKVKGAEGSQHPGVRNFALRAVEGCPERDDWAQACAIYRAVKERITFRGEEGETVQTPWLTLQQGAGDCDDMTGLIVASLRSLGIPAQIQTIATHQQRAFSHVYPMAGIRKNGQLVEWRALDVTVPGTEPGWRPPDATRRKTWPVDAGGTMQQMGSFFGILKDIGKVGEGFIEGGPTGAAKAAIVTELQAKQRKRARHLAMRQAAAAAGMSGYDSGQVAEIRASRGREYVPRFFAAPLPDESLHYPRRIPVSWNPERDALMYSYPRSQANPNDPGPQGGNYASRWYPSRRVYMGDFDPSHPFTSLNTTEKIIGGVAFFALVLAATR